MQYRFDEFVLDTERFELSQNDKPLHCEPQVFELLQLLVSNHDRMVSKEEINQTIWHGRTVSESALSSRIKMLRQLLGDNGRTQRFIRTVHKRGFHFIANVTFVNDSSTPEKNDSCVEPDTEHSSANNLAVMILPFSNLSSEPGHEYLSDGITTDIISYLAKHRWLDVVARNTAFGFKGRAVDICEIGTELNIG
jgi:DNA-binding winged helix-turn-helix (wHTH) protein